MNENLKIGILGCNGFVGKNLTNFLKKRTFEFVGLLLISISIGLIISFITYSYIYIYMLFICHAR